MDNIPIAAALINQLAKSKSKPLCNKSPSLPIRFQTPEASNVLTLTKSKYLKFTPNSGVSLSLILTLAIIRYIPHIKVEQPMYQRCELKKPNKTNMTAAFIRLETRFLTDVTSNLFFIKGDTIYTLNTNVNKEFKQSNANNHLTSATKFTGICITYSKKTSKMIDIIAKTALITTLE